MATAITCSYCLELLQKPVQSKNGHRFCQECFYKRNHALQCQRCVEDGIPRDKDCFQLGKEEFFADRAVVFDMNKLEARCRTCCRVDSYFEIMKNHIRKPCQMPILSKTVSTWT